MKLRFSNRMGLAEDVPTIQTDGMNNALRNSLWNFLHFLYESRNDYWIPAANSVARFFLKVPVDELPYEDYECRRWLKDHFYKLKWYEVYDLIEFIVENHGQIIRYPEHQRDELEELFNIIFEQELSGYRFISGILAPISSPAEIAEISGAIEATGRAGLDGAHEHLRAALTLLGKKPEPDYRNSIKEAISAVESISKQLSGSVGQGLSGALDELAKHVDIHGALKAGFIKLYGYTSDKDGIRHAILDQPTVGFAEAKYMIVSCSAFVNYLILKAQQSGLMKK
jgi:hypothetical protein